MMHVHEPDGRKYFVFEVTQLLVQRMWRTQQMLIALFVFLHLVSFICSLGRRHNTLQ